MKRSTDRILTTHAGSLPRPDELLPLLYARAKGDALDPAAKTKIQNAISTVVGAQAETGIDVISDGEFGKSGFWDM
jgi:5-methyltetrahydropteroyltriglutamate--homocysteine methyltransferase